MNEEPKSVWRRPWKGPAQVAGGLLIVFGLALLVSFSVLYLATAPIRSPDFERITVLVSLVLAVVGVLILVSFRWLCTWHNFKRFLFVVACLATLIALFYAEEDWRGRRDWEQFKREWEAKGERFDRASVVPPPVPDDRNFALTPVVASSYLTFLDQRGHRVRPSDTNVINRLEISPLAYEDRQSLVGPTNGDWRVARATDLSDWQRYYRELAAKTNEFPAAARPQSPPADVLLALSKYDATIADLRQARQLPEARFPLEYDLDDPGAMVLPHLDAVKKCAQVLQLRTIAELQAGQSEQALADIKLVLGLADSIRGEPILISQLVRLAMVNIALQPAWEGLAAHRWSEAQLAELDTEFARLDFLAGHQLALRGEMDLCQGGVFEVLRRKAGYLFRLLDVSSSIFAKPMIYLVPRGWLYQNQLRCARPIVERYVPAVDVNQGRVSPSSVRRADLLTTAETSRPTAYNLMERLLLPAFGSATRKFAFGQNAVNLARTACALERHRLVHGAYPDSLDALAPEFIAKLPHDVINGQPLRYHCTPDGQFVLYSVGWNETDDGGEVGLTEKGSVDIQKGDWVWRYPLKAE